MVWSNTESNNAKLAVWHNYKKIIECHLPVFEFATVCIDCICIIGSLFLREPSLTYYKTCLMTAAVLRKHNLFQNKDHKNAGTKFKKPTGLFSMQYCTINHSYFYFGKGGLYEIFVCGVRRYQLEHQY